MRPLAIQIQVNPNLFLRDPLDTSLGKRIVGQSVELIDRIGLDQFTFKKLAKELQSSEPSVYRYFENKHQLFVYLLNWYWEWMIARIDLNTMNLQDPKARLWVALDMVVDTVHRNMDFAYLDEVTLHRVIVREGAKGYHHVLVDEENKGGFFLAYKRLCDKIADLILGAQPGYPYPKATATMLVETANNNLYFAQHLPRLTDLEYAGPDYHNDLMEQVKELLRHHASQLLGLGE